MTLKTFLIGMLASFGLAWMFMIAIPVAKMGALPAVKMNAEEDADYYQHKTSGRIRNGAEIYASNGCYTCHSQLIRPTYLGSQIWRKDIAGVYDKKEDIDTRRETSVDDFAGEKYAQIGLTRMGPDLSNFGYRAETYGKQLGISAEQWIVNHLHNPRSNELRRGEQGERLDMTWSNCPSQPQMFDKIPMNGQGDSLALTKKTKKGLQIVPAEQARVLASYLISLKRDDQMPESMDHGRKEEAEAK
jgi:cytochrome c oxidase cbb3-type subunit 2